MCKMSSMSDLIYYDSMLNSAESNVHLSMKMNIKKSYCRSNAIKFTEFPQLFDTNHVSDGAFLIVKGIKKNGKKNKSRSGSNADESFSVD